jgi:hypothetical protein
MINTVIASCNSSTLDPYVPGSDNPWNQAKVKHCYRRLGYGTDYNTTATGVNVSPGALIDQIVDSAAATPLREDPVWGYYRLVDFNDYNTENPEFINDFRIETGNLMVNDGLKGRMIFFWLNHFVTELDAYNYAPYLFQYYRTAEQHVLGNFKDLVHDMGLTPAMLFYLNGFQNTNTEPNENYARELYELFTLGEGNGYTQEDIIETSKALTGWNLSPQAGGQIIFNTNTFFNGDKTIFGQTGNWDYHDVIDILFQERGELIAQHICRKLYRYFVSPDIDLMIETNIIMPMAQTMIDNNFELVPVLKQLFKSEHFFDEKALGVIIKSPFDLIFQFVNESAFLFNDDLMEAFIYYAAVLGQIMFNPPDVAGWQGDQDWIGTSTITGRWALFRAYLYLLFDSGQEERFRALAIDLSNDSNDPAYITRVLVDHFNARELFTSTDYDVATEVFKWEIPQNYYDDRLWNLSWAEAPYQVLLLLNHLATWPEFQLK